MIQAPVPEIETSDIVMITPQTFEEEKKISKVV